MFRKKKLPPKDGGNPTAEEPPEQALPDNCQASAKEKGEPLPQESSPDSGQTVAAPPAKGKRKRLPPGDDGRTIADMNVDGMPWYNPTMGKVKNEDKPTRKEKRALIRAGYLAYLPAFLMVLLGFTAAVLIIYLWMHGWTF